MTNPQLKKLLQNKKPLDTNINSMTDQELDFLLTERCNSLDLKKIAFNALEKIFKENSSDKHFLEGFEQDKIKPIFERFEYQIKRQKGVSIIRTRIGLYIEDKEEIWFNNLKPIGYYALDTDFSGTELDDWFVID